MQNERIIKMDRELNFDEFTVWNNPFISEQETDEHTDGENINNSWDRLIDSSEEEESEKIVYYTYTYKGKQFSCYEAFESGMDWNCDYPLPRKAKVHSWQYQKKELQSDDPKRYQNKRLIGRKIKSWPNETMHHFRKGYGYPKPTA